MTKTSSAERGENGYEHADTLRDEILSMPDDAFSGETFFSSSVGNVVVSATTHGLDGSPPVVPGLFALRTSVGKERKVSKKRLSQLLGTTDETRGRMLAHDLACEGKLNREEMVPEVLSTAENDGRSVAHILAQHGFLGPEHTAETEHLVWDWKDPRSGETVSMTVGDVLRRRAEHPPRTNGTEKETARRLEQKNE